MTEGVLSRISRVASSSLPNAALVNDADRISVGDVREVMRLLADRDGWIGASGEHGGLSVSGRNGPRLCSTSTAGNHSTASTATKRRARRSLSSWGSRRAFRVALAAVASRRGTRSTTRSCASAPTANARSSKDDRLDKTAMRVR